MLANRVSIMADKKSDGNDSTASTVRGPPRKPRQSGKKLDVKNQFVPVLTRPRSCNLDRELTPPD